MRKFPVTYFTVQKIHCNALCISCVLHMHGSRLGRRAAALQKALQESRGLQETQMLQGMHQKVSVWPWCLRQRLHCPVRSHAVSPAGCSWKPLALPASVICTAAVLAPSLHRSLLIFQQCALTGNTAVSVLIRE